MSLEWMGPYRNNLGQLPIREVIDFSTISAASSTAPSDWFPWHKSLMRTPSRRHYERIERMCSV